jgi:hypothetical protein
MSSSLASKSGNIVAHVPFSWVSRCFIDLKLVVRQEKKRVTVSPYNLLCIFKVHVDIIINSFHINLLRRVL